MNITESIQAVNIKVRRRWRLPRDVWLGYALLFPTMAFIFLVVAYPTGHAIYMSFFRNLVGFLDRPFVGLDNYIKVIGDELFWESLGRTLTFTGYSVPLKLTLGMATALVLHKKFPGVGWLRALVLIPWALPPLTSVLTWKFLFHDSTNVLSTVLVNLNLLDRPIPWLGVPRYAMPSAIIVNVWRGFPFFAITLLAGLAPIPAELYEAAKIDGAGVIQRFRHITIPGVMPVLLVSTTLSTIWTLNEFTTIWLLTAGGPFNTTMTLPIAAYWEAFGRGSKNLSKGVVYAIGLFPILLGLILVLSRGISSREEEN